MDRVLATEALAGTLPALSFFDVFAVSPNAYMVLDRELRYVTANPAYLRATATRLEDLVGRHLFDVFPNDASDPNNASAVRLLRSLERVVVTGKPDVLAVIPYRVARVTGGPLEERIWSATHTPIKGPDGAVAFVLQHTVDVSDLRDGAHERAERDPERVAVTTQTEAGVLGRAQRAAETVASLNEEVDELRMMFEQAPGFVAFLMGDAHTIHFTNAAYGQLVGHRELVGRAIRDALPELAGQGFVELLDRVRVTKAPFVGRSMRVMLQREPGAPLEERFVDFVYQPIVTHSGQSKGILVQGNDVTDRVSLLERERAARAAAEAAMREEVFLAEAIPVQVWTARPDGRLDLVNTRVVDYFGTTREEILGAGWQTRVYPDDLPAVLERWSRSLATGEPYEVEFRLRSAEGSWRWHLARAIALRDVTGAILKWFGTNTDIDEAKRHQEAEQRLIGIVSHDLKNPLSVIGMAASVLKMRVAEKDQHILDKVINATGRSTRLISDFLDFAHTRVSGVIPIHPDRTDLERTVRAVVDECAFTDPARRVLVEHEGPTIGVWDSDRLHQVLGNLVGNAFQHGSSEREIRIRSAIRGDIATVTVQNFGALIPPRELERIFEPFERGERSDRSRGRSVGLGLFIARQVVFAHGGTLTVTSTEADGTTFVVTLPRETRSKNPEPARAG